MNTHLGCSPNSLILSEGNQKFATLKQLLGILIFKLFIKKQTSERTFASYPTLAFLPKRFRQKNLLQEGNLSMLP